MKTFSMKPGEKEKTREIPCPLCRTEKHEKNYLNPEGFSYVKCPECSLVFQNPQPVFEDLGQRYDQEYFEYEQENEKAFFQLMLLGLKDIEFDIIEEGLGDEKRFLDIGCATGLLLADMKRRGWDAEGVEICAPAADYGIRERALSIFKGPLEEADFQDKTFDIVHLSHVIEHVNDPGAFVRDIFRILKPGGYIICTTPNIQGLQARLFKEEWRSVIPDHLFLFSVKNLRRLLKESGFTKFQHRTWGGLCAGRGKPFIKKILDRTAKKAGFGDVVIIRGQKPLS